MNWKEHAHLFANGKFKVRIDSHATENVIIPIRTIDVSMIEVGDVRINNTTKVNNCTLIARPISDMTDEECTESLLFDCLKDKAEPKYIREELIRMNHLRRTMRLCLYLLSIGVYPFDQDDETVIFKPE